MERKKVVDIWGWKVRVNEFKPQQTLASFFGRKNQSLRQWFDGPDFSPKEKGKGKKT